MCQSRDLYRFTLGPAVVTPPGRVFCDNSGASKLLGAVIRKAAKQPIEDFARYVLFGPLGITDITWTKLPNSNTAAACGCLRLRRRDMAKLGQLLLTDGNWDGKQIVPSESDRRVDRTSDRRSEEPGFLRLSMVARPLAGQGKGGRWVFVAGHGGQRVYVVLECDLVMILTAGLYDSLLQYWEAVNLLNPYCTGVNLRLMPHQNRLEVETQSRCWTSWRDAVHT